MSDDFISGDDHDPFDPVDASRAHANKARVVDDLVTSDRAFLLRRQEAYKRVFQGAPMGEDLTIVIEDLKRFCRGDATTFDNDARIHALLTGRQEVYLRIMDHVRKPFDELYNQYTRSNNQ